MENIFIITWTFNPIPISENIFSVFFSFIFFLEKKQEGKKVFPIRLDDIFILWEKRVYNKFHAIDGIRKFKSVWPKLY